MTAALFGLLGVVLGGVITAGWNFWLKVFEHKQARRVAARSVIDELLVVRASLTNAVSFEKGSLLHPEDLEQLAKTWREHRIALASLPPGHWRDVQVVVAALVMYRRVDESEWTPGTVANFEQMQRLCEQGNAILGPYASGPSGLIGWLVRRT